MIQNVHLKAPKNWINDPNGFIYYQGNYHLFYQYFPYGTRWGTMHWGHAVSKDLVSWEHKGLALFPTKYEDQNGCFSGSAIEDGGKLYLVYTGIHYHVPNPEDIHVCLEDQFEASQMLITSEDGVQFDNYYGKQVLIPPITDSKIGDRTHTRDPKVWRGTDAWYLVVGSRSKHTGGKLLFYQSQNLTEWSYVNQVSKSSQMGWMWECPDYYEVNGEKVLMFSPMGLLKDGRNYENQAICTCVEFDEESCAMTIPDAYQFVDYGLDLYAPQSTVDEEGRRVLVAWMRMPEPVEGKWIGMYVMPRIVEVENGHIYFRLHPNLKQAFNKKIESVTEANEGYCISIDLEEGTYICVGGYRIERKDGKIYTDRSQVFQQFENSPMKFETPEIQEGFHLDIYVDPHLIEVYINQGEYVVSNVVYNLTQEIDTNSNTEYTIFTIS